MAAAGGNSATSADSVTSLHAHPNPFRSWGQHAARQLFGEARRFASALEDLKVKIYLEIGGTGQRLDTASSNIGSQCAGFDRVTVFVGHMA